MGSLFGGGGGGDIKAPPFAPPPLKAMPVSLDNPELEIVAQAAKRRAAQAAGRGFAGTVKTSSQGTAAPATSGPSLIGAGL